MLIPANTRQGVPPPGWQAYIVCLVGLPPDMVDGGSNVFLLVRCNILYLGYWVVAWYTSEVRLLLWDYHTLYQQFGYGNSVAVALFIWLYHCLIDLNNNSFVSCSFVRIIFVAAHLFITYCFGFLINLLISALVDLISSSLFVLYSCSFGMLALLLLKLSKGLMVLFFFAYLCCIPATQYKYHTVSS